jgi:hypothetical protein
VCATKRQRVHEGDGLEVVGEGEGLLDRDIGAVAGELPAVELGEAGNDLGGAQCVTRAEGSSSPWV